VEQPLLPNLSRDTRPDNVRFTFQLFVCSGWFTIFLLQNEPVAVDLNSDLFPDVIPQCMDQLVSVKDCLTWCNYNDYFAF
jgi:hypothetical protein